MQEFMSVPLRQMAYQPLGDIRLKFPGHENATHYQRRLDLDQAVASVSYDVDGVHHERQVFSSYPDQVLVIRIGADQKGKVGFTRDDGQPALLEGAAYRARRPGCPVGAG